MLIVDAVWKAPNAIDNSATMAMALWTLGVFASL
jgi:hypothetical protein